MTKRGALIGCGFFAENHLHAWTEIEGAEIVAICDVNDERLKTVGEKFSIASRYSGVSELLASEALDFIDIATTVASHKALVDLCAINVDTLLCQKPFAETVADAKGMVATCEAQGVNLIVHENFRWQNAFLRMKAMVDEGTIGTPNFARFSFRHGYDNYTNQPYLAEIDRFSIMDVGLHLFDLARHFMGEVSTLSCVAQSLNPIVRGEDAFTALLQHHSGATCVCDCSFFSQYTPEPFPRTTAVIEGDTGTLELLRDYTLIVHKDNKSQHLDVEPPVPAWGTKPWHAVQQSVLAFQRHALDVMNGSALPQPSGADNLETLRLALAAYESSDTGRTIDMSIWQEMSQ